jgi:hypothetical protein
MKGRALEWKIVCLIALLVAAVPLMFTACGGGIMAPNSSGSSQQSQDLTITSIVPNSGPLSGGTVVTINGSNFTSSTQTAPPSVSFGGTQATNVKVLSPLQLSATVPSHAAGSVNVQVTTADGQSSTLAQAFNYTSSTLTVSKLSPISGPAAGGTTVTINGADFLSGVSVTFGGLPASSVNLTNSTTLVVVTPSHASGSADVTITNSDGTSASLSSGYTFHSIDLLWNAPTSSTATITGYNVYRGLASSGPFGRVNTALVADTSFNDLTVLGGTTYYYEVKSVDSNGTESAPAGPVPATTSP